LSLIVQSAGLDVFLAHDLEILLDRQLALPEALAGLACRHFPSVATMEVGSVVDVVVDGDVVGVSLGAGGCSGSAARVGAKSGGRFSTATLAGSPGDHAGSKTQDVRELKYFAMDVSSYRIFGGLMMVVGVIFDGVVQRPTRW
jgi:hypothetical protein